MGPFLRKIFEGINGLEFQPDTNVTAMFSEEGEKVPFLHSFNPKVSICWQMAVKCCDMGTARCCLWIVAQFSMFPCVAWFLRAPESVANVM